MNGLRAIALLLLLALAPVREGRSAPAPRPVPADSRPNLLVIMTDDQTVDQMKALPKTRRLLAARGTTFVNSFVDFSLCCPSRSTFLTGQYAHNHGVLANGGPHGGYVHLDHSNTLPLWLQEAGYYTAHVGKYLNNYGKNSPAPPPGWSRWFALTDPSVYRMYDYTVSDGGKPVTYGEAPGDYQTDVIAAKAEEILRSRAGSRQPFFVTVAPTSPHLERLTRDQTPPRPAPRYVGRYAAEPLPRKPSFDEADVTDKPGHIGRRPRLSPGKSAHVLETYRACLASLLAADDLVERLVKALDETGQLGRTVIVFTSDNGFFFGEHRVTEGKYLPYEESIRVPLIVFDGRKADGGRRFPAGATVTQPVSNIDLAPTLVALAGARARRVMDGRSLLPLVRDPRQGKDRTLLIEGYGEGHDKPPFAAVRDPRWFYAEYRNGDRELYDLRNDPYELRSLHADPAFEAVRRDLAGRLARLRSCSGESCG